MSVAKNLSETCFSIPQVLKSGPKVFEDEVIGIVFPCYVSSIPTIVEEFFQQVELRGKYIFALVTYGNLAFNGACIRCYACTQNCPSNAIRLAGEKSQKRYRNKDVALKEIIEANA